MGRHYIGGLVLRVVAYPYYLRNNVPRLPHHNGIPDIHPQLGDEILVMQRRAAHRCSCQLNRVKFRRRRDGAGAPYLQRDAAQHRFLFLRRVLERHRPFGVFGGAAQSLPVGKAVHLYHGSVDLVSQLAAQLSYFLNLADGLLDGMDHLVVGGYRKAQRAHQLQRSLVAFTHRSLQLLDIKAEDIQPSGGGNLRVFLPQRAGSGIAGIFGWGLFPQLLLPNQPPKTVDRHIHLAAHLQKRQRLRQLQRDTADGADIFRHVLPHQTVAAGGTDRQLSVAVLQRNRKPVNLLLHHIGRLRHRFPNPLVKGAQLIQGKYILQ